MPLYYDRFSGHFESADPRTPLHGAAGCIWPTVPAFRYCLKSDNATGVFWLLNFTGILVIRTTAAVDHDDYRYVPIAPPPPYNITRCRKVWNPLTTGYRWEVDMDLGSGLCPVSWRIERPNEKCNVNVILGARSCPSPPPLGSTGSTFRMLQVVYDEACPVPPP